MILLKFDNVSNKEVLNRIYSDIIEHKMQNIVEIIYTFNPKKSIEVPENLILSYFQIKAKDFEGMDEFDIEEVFFDLIENEYPLVINFDNASSEIMNLVKNIAKDIELNYLDTSNFFNPDIYQKGNASIINTVYEIYELPSRRPSYSLKNFLYVLEVNNNGEFKTKHNRVIGNIKNESLESFVFKQTSDYKKRKSIISEFSQENLFSNQFGNLLIFINEIKDVELKIQKFKKDVFEQLLNIDAKDYKRLDREVVELLNEYNYIKMDDILNIKENEGVLEDEQVSNNHFFVID